MTSAPSDEGQITEGERITDELYEKYSVAFKQGWKIGQPDTSKRFLEDLEKLQAFIDVSNHQIGLAYQTARDAGGGFIAILVRDSVENKYTTMVNNRRRNLERGLSNFENQIMAVQGKMSAIYRPDLVAS